MLAHWTVRRRVRADKANEECQGGDGLQPVGSLTCPLKIRNPRPSADFTLLKWRPARLDQESSSLFRRISWRLGVAQNPLRVLGKWASGPVWPICHLFVKKQLFAAVQSNSKSLSFFTPRGPVPITETPEISPTCAAFKSRSAVD